MGLGAGEKRLVKTRKIRKLRYFIHIKRHDSLAEVDSRRHGVWQKRKRTASPLVDAGHQGKSEFIIARRWSACTAFKEAERDNSLERTCHIKKNSS